MILQALARYYQRLFDRNTEGVPPYGYSLEKINYEIVLSQSGNVIAVNPLGNTNGKKMSQLMLTVPASFKRPGTGSKAFFLWDKASYVLGVGKDGRRALQDHEAFKALHQRVLAGEEDEGLVALLAFLKRWSPEQFRTPQFPTEMVDANVVFRFDNEYRHLHERPAAREIYRRLLEASNNELLQGVCLITGQSGPLARLHPPIKGIPRTQTSGADIVSFNDDAYLSYRGSAWKVEAAKKVNNSGASAPISEQAAFAYTSVLNYLLRSDRARHQRLQIGDTKVVFWAEAAGSAEEAQAAEDFLSSLFAPPEDEGEAERLRAVLDGVSRGKPLAEFDPMLAPGTRMYVLGLAPNVARLSVRYWQVDTLDAFAKRLAQHAQDMRIEPLPWRIAPSVRRLALATAPSGQGEVSDDDVPPLLAGELMRAILTGSRYPESLLAVLVMRMRADGNISGVRVALCKAVLARKLRAQHSKKEIPVGLDPNETNSGYLLGRLFFLLERAQQCALGSVNAGVKEKYYGSASATPSLVFPVIIRNFENHLSKLSKGSEKDRRIAHAIEREVGLIINRLPTHYPSHLSLEEQGCFSIGYYHQAHAQFTKRDANGDAAAAEHTETETEGAN